MKDSKIYVIAGLLALASVPLYVAIYYRHQLEDAIRSIEPIDGLQGTHHFFRYVPAAGERQCIEGHLYNRLRDSAEAVLVDGHMVSCDGQNVAVQPAPKRYAYGEALPSGAKCSGANGIVYMTRQEHGSTVIEPLLEQGRPVTCAGTYSSAHVP
jgi:hypothetical protein